MGPLFADSTSTFEALGDHQRAVLPRSSITQLEGTPPADWRLLAHSNVLYTFSPNASVLVQDGHFAMILMSPVAPDRTRIDLLTVGRPIPERERGEKVRAFLEANHAFTVRTLEEDFVLAEQIHRGLDCGANETLRFARFEDALTAWHARLDARLAACIAHSRK